LLVTAPPPLAAADPEHQTAEKLYLAARREDDAEKVVKLCTQALELDNSLIEAYRQRAIALAHLGMYGDAVADLRLAISLAPSDPNNKITLGNILTDQVGDCEAAIVEYTAAISLDPKNARAYLGRANAHLKCQDQVSALSDYSELIQLDASNGDALCNRAVLYSKMNQHEDAVVDFSAAILLSPRDAELYFNRGLTLTHMWKFSEAVDDFTAAIALAPLDPRSHYTRGIARLESGEQQAPVNDIYTAGLLYIHMGDATWATLCADLIEDVEPEFGLAERLRSFTPESAFLLNELGLAFAQEGIDEAHSMFVAAMAVDPLYADARNNLAVYLYHRGDATAALEQWLLLSSIAPDYPHLQENIQAARDAAVGGSIESPGDD